MPHLIKWWADMVGRIMPHLLKMSTVLTFRTCDFYLTGKRNFAGIIKLRVSRWGDNPWCLSRSKIITKVFVRRRQKCQSQRMRYEWKKGQRGATLLALEMEKGEWTKEYARPLLKKAENRFLLRASRRNIILPTPWF